MMLASLLAGCGRTYFVLVEPETKVELERREALLVLQIDTDVPLTKLSLTGLYLKQAIPVGEHFWIARVRPGRQSWLSVSVGEKSAYAGRYKVVRSQYPRRGELDFEVEPGAINYAGEVIVRKAGRNGLRTWLSVRVRNHSATALRKLESSYSELLDLYPVRFAGTSGDTFLEFYSAERKRVHAEREARAIEDEGS